MGDKEIIKVLNSPGWHTNSTEHYTVRRRGGYIDYIIQLPEGSAILTDEFIREAALSVENRLLSPIKIIRERANKEYDNGQTQESEKEES